MRGRIRASGTFRALRQTAVLVALPAFVLAGCAVEPGGEPKKRPGPSIESAKIVSGTAVSVAPGGHWLTAGHVVSRCARVLIILADKSRLAASVTAIESPKDLALLRTDPRPAAIPLARDDPPAASARYLVVGFPDGHYRGLQLRFLSYVQRQIPDFEVPEGRLRFEGDLQAWVSAAQGTELPPLLSGGMSGGPILTDRNEISGLLIGARKERNEDVAVLGNSCRSQGLSVFEAKNDMAHGTICRGQFFAAAGRNDIEAMLRRHGLIDDSGAGMSPPTLPAIMDARIDALRHAGLVGQAVCIR